VAVQVEALETKTITSAVGSGGGLIAPGNRVTYSRQTGRTINAAMVAESAQKPYSDCTRETVQAPVRTLARLMKVSRQALDDAPALMSIIDAEMRYGFADTEDAQMLAGNGTGQNLTGILPLASVYNPPFSVADESPLDRLVMAEAQLAAVLYEADGIVLNPVDWFRMVSTKDGQGR
jgi:HK97 family phage major capsid protein